MTNQTVGVTNTPAANGVSNVDVSELLVGNVTVERQRINISDPNIAGNLANVTSAGALSVDPSGVTAIGDLTIAIKNMLSMLMGLPLAIDPASARLRVVLDPLGGAQTLGAVTTVGSITSTVSAKVLSFGSVGPDSSSSTFDIMMDCWANNVRRNIT